MKRPRTALLGLVATAGFLLSPSIAQASTAQPQVSGTCTGWSSSPTPHCGKALQAATAHATPAWANDKGCGGYYTGSDPKEMQCRGVAVTINNFPVAIRYGYWAPGNSTSPDGFGWSKAYYYHNLWMQPMLDTIANAIPSGANNDRQYELYHYTAGERDQEVIVVADIQDPYFAGIHTQDGKAVGVITGYCLTGGGVQEPECPPWVDEDL
jgi:hypothetical protein